MSISALDHIVANNLSYFIEKSFHTLEPTTDYLHNWHIDAIADYLDACEDGEISKLIINMPPRAMKSKSVSIAWPAYLLGRDPTRQVVVGSYSATLSEKLSVDTKKVMQSSWYQRVFPETRFKRGQNKKSMFELDAGGHRMATSVGGSVTGFGGDFLILDDPVKPDDANSKAKRETANEWMTGTFFSRANNPRKFCLVLVMQRLHEEDCSGILLDMKDQLGDIEQLILPAEFEKKTQIMTPSRIYDVDKGELLQPDRFSEDVLAEKRRVMGAYAYAGQYQQKPAPAGGGVIKTKWFKAFEERPLGFNYLVHSWDTAFKGNAGNDPSVCTIWGVRPEGYYLVGIWKGRVEYPDLKKKVKELGIRDNPDYILIEDKASGQSLIQDLRVSDRFTIVDIPVHKDKISRMSSASPDIEAGNVFIDGGASWLEDFLDECKLFPNAKNDDQVDSMSQFLMWAKNNPLISTEPKAAPPVDFDLAPASGWSM